ncbi:Uncharacterized protein HZ326_13101 [Fusarium oxysporum f. sp. albedinis]|nr:Uncharacterized protein HZ326_13101 [Fusarium oxysporum f. sp. albedinis]
MAETARGLRDRALWVFLIRRHTTALGYYRKAIFLRHGNKTIGWLFCQDQQLRRKQLFSRNMRGTTAACLRQKALIRNWEVSDRLKGPILSALFVLLGFISTSFLFCDFAFASSVLYS